MKKLIDSIAKVGLKVLTNKCIECVPKIEDAFKLREKVIDKIKKLSKAE